MHFMKSEANSNIYYLMVGGKKIILINYVDDILLIGSSGLRDDRNRDLVVEFEMKDLGLMHYFLGMEVWKTYKEIFLG